MRPTLEWQPHCWLRGGPILALSFLRGDLIAPARARRPVTRDPETDFFPGEADRPARAWPAARPPGRRISGRRAVCEWPSSSFQNVVPASRVNSKVGSSPRTARAVSLSANSKKRFIQRNWCCSGREIVVAAKRSRCQRTSGPRPTQAIWRRLDFRAVLSRISTWHYPPASGHKIGRKKRR